MSWEVPVIPHSWGHQSLFTGQDSTGSQCGPCRGHLLCTAGLYGAPASETVTLAATSVETRQGFVC